MIAEISGRPSSPVPVRAVTVTTEVMSVPELVMNAFEPSTTHCAAASSTALVRVAPASLPASGSVRPKPASARPGDEVGQEALLLGLAAVGEDRVDAQAHAGREGDADRLVDPAELLDRDAQAREGAAVGVLERAAELLGHDEAEQPELAHARHEVGREVVRHGPTGRRAARRPRSRTRGRPCGSPRGPCSARTSALLRAGGPGPGSRGAAYGHVLDVDVNVKQYSPVCQPPPRMPCASAAAAAVTGRGRRARPHLVDRAGRARSSGSPTARCGTTRSSA